MKSKVFRPNTTSRHTLLTQSPILQCDAGAAIELDGVLHPVSPHCAILIPPGVRHRGVGEMSVLIYCTPKFDPEDEFFDELA
jgi:hypothetical protein